MNVTTSKRNRGRRHQTGAALVELALSLPLFMVVFFIIIWVSVTMHSEVALTSAVSSGVRLAMPRGKPDLQDDIHIAAAHPATFNPAQLKVLLAPNTDIPNLDAVEEWVGGNFSTNGAPTTLRQLPPHYLYAMIYATQHMYRSVGHAMRPGCDPLNRGATPDPRNGVGCLRCVPLRPDTLRDSLDGLAGSPGRFETENPGARQLMRQRIALRCEYQPTHLILNPIQAFFNVFVRRGAPPQLVYRRTKIFDVNEE